MDLTHGSLFSGIGGFDLGFERAGFKTIWQVEIDDYATKVLEKHWPNVPRFRDIRLIDWRSVPVPTVLTGGFPCQDISVAGKGAGIKEDTRSGLWSHFHRAISVLRPPYVVVENVSALLFRGMGRVLGDLSEIGYDAEWEIISASTVGALHKRERVFLVAYPRAFGWISRTYPDCGCSILRVCHQHWQRQKISLLQRRQFQSRFDTNVSDTSHVADSDRERIERSRTQTLPRFAAFSWCENIRSIEDLRRRPNLPEPLVRTKDDGVSREVDALGNAVVPQIAEEIAWMIRRHIEESNA